MINISERRPGIAGNERHARRSRHAHSPSVSVGAQATGAHVIGSLALAAVAVGAVAIGALAIGRLFIRRARVERLEIDELVVRRLRITEELDFPPDPDTASG